MWYNARTLRTEEEHSMNLSRRALDLIPWVSGGRGVRYLLLVFLFAACTPAPAGDQPPVGVSTGKGEDRVTVTTTGSQVVLDIYSPSGIGSARVTLGRGQRPTQVLMRLHLVSLEGLRFAYGVTVVQVAVLGPDHTVQESVGGQGGAQKTITAGSPYWMPVQVVGNPAAGVKSAYFEVTAPQDFIMGANSIFNLSWVDYYR
jgi:hypothetical protein